MIAMLEKKRTCDRVVGDYADALGLGHASLSTAGMAPVWGYGAGRRAYCKCVCGIKWVN